MIALKKATGRNPDWQVDRFWQLVYHEQSDLTSFDNVYFDHTNTLQEIYITDDDVYLALAELDPKKAMGIDEIGSKILKNCALTLNTPVPILNLMIEHLLQTKCRPISLL